MAMTEKDSLKAASVRMAEQVIQAIADGKGATWLKPWSGGEFRNIFSEKGYNGFNPMWCRIYCNTHGYKSPLFVTCQKVFSIGKEKGIRINIDNPKRILTICYYSIIIKKNEETQKDEYKGRFLKYFNVYNIEQIENHEEIFAEQLQKLDNITPTEKNSDVSRFFDQYFINENISFGEGGDSAYYSPSKHHVQMPNVEQFVGQAEYCSVLAHEAIHSTGLELKRFKVGDGTKFGSEIYSEEELVAELGSVQFGEELGFISERTVRNSEAYLIGWASKLKNQPEMLLNAAIKASQAIKYIVKIVEKENEQTETVAA